MKITVNQLRRIIKEEVGRVMEGEGFVPVRGMSAADAEAIDTAIENLRGMLDKVSPVLKPGILRSIDDLEALRDETDYGTEEEEPYTDEEPMFESRRKVVRKR